MNKYLKGTMWVGLSVLTTIGLAACNKNASAEGPQYAEVVSSTPIKKTINNPHQECHNEAVTVHKPVKDEHQIAGTAIGAVVGGALGNQVGGGNGKKLATVAGAVAGGYAGHQIQKHHQENATETVNKQVCKTVNHPRQECHNEAVTVHKPVKDEHQIAGTAIGAVVGGALGNQIGGGDGKKLATVAGAVAGGYAGHQIQ
ncbi:MAG TPA: glycine zipper 2TM domain-containing protein, partial [Oleiagrimonas sp.]|nr:glycine zipper 2TM domain-containing protein [Oleiagrimonas sp.]